MISIFFLNKKIKHLKEQDKTKIQNEMNINTCVNEIDIKSRDIIKYLQYERFLKEFFYDNITQK